ncbi:Fic family protein [Arthrobacter psychrolactophilus]
MPAPNIDAALKNLASTGDTEKLTRILQTHIDDSAYFHWDQLRHRTPPQKWTHEDWWLSIKFRRRQQRRTVRLRDKSGSNFSYVLTDKILEACEEISSRASGQVAAAERVLTTQGRDKYIVKSLVEEAITSSQLEGASTSRRVAKELLETGRDPSDKSETMIFNNYVAMQYIKETAQDELTPERVLHLHKMLADGTLDDPEDAGRLETPDHTRVSVWDQDLQVHVPPPAEELPQRLQELCDFANGTSQAGRYLPPVVRSIIVHFMLGYDHYFIDGNGRTARALFYWSMLHEGYWLSEYVTISRILRKAPSKYAVSYLYTEDDEGDLTYFIHHQLDVFLRAMNDLDAYLSAKSQELKSVRAALQSEGLNLNHRQIDTLEWLAREESHSITVQSYAKKYRIGDQTARNDLNEMTQLGHVIAVKIGRANHWRANPNLQKTLGL